MKAVLGKIQAVLGQIQAILGQIQAGLGARCDLSFTIHQLIDCLSPEQGFMFGF